MQDKGKRKIILKSLLTYASRLKRKWSVLVYDARTKKRAVGSSLPEAIEKLGEPPKEADLVVIDQKTTEKLTEDKDE